MKKKLPQYLWLLLIIFLVILFAVYQNPQWFMSTDNSELLRYSKLTVSNQPLGNSVVIDYATLPLAGYIIVRNDLGDLSGDIVGVSSYLKVGRYKAISIPLKSMTKMSQKLVAELVADNGNRQLDQSDQRITNSRGQPVTAAFLIIDDKLLQKVPAE